MSEIERLLVEIDTLIRRGDDLASPTWFYMREGIRTVRCMAEAIVLERSYHSLRRAGYSE